MEILGFLFGIIGCVLVGWFANAKRNRNGVAWGLLAVLITPIIAFVILLFLKKLD